MRFIFAIVSFVIAAVLIGTGIAQKTVLLPPDHVTASVAVTSDATVTIIDGATMATFPHSQTLDIGGSPTIFAAYGRTVDVTGWVGDASYNELTYDPATKNLVSTTITGSETAVPDPTGSDLWLAEYSSDLTLKQRMSVDDSVSLVIVSNGTDPAPTDVSISWPIDNATPWSTPLLIAGAVILLIGLALLLWAIANMRSSRGPRRRSPKMPKLPKQPRYKPSKARKALPTGTRGRRSTRTAMVAAPIAIASIIALSGCTADPTVAPIQPTPTASGVTESDNTSQADPPAVSKLQATRIVQRITQVVTEADKELDSKLLATRFTGAALDLRTSQYKIKKADDSQPLPSSIADKSVKIVLPQQNAGWPRTVFVVLKDDTDQSIAPTALMLVQDTARSQYLVHYAVDLEPGVTVPDSAPTELGTSRVDPDQPSFYTVAPSALATDYGDILNKGDESEFYSLFDSTGDTLQAEVGVEAKAKLKKDLPDTAKLTFSNAQDDGQVIVMATLDAGAIVAVGLNEKQTVKPVETGAAVNAPKSMKALAGKTVSTIGFTATYSDQLLFYVPSSTDPNPDAKVLLLGYSTGLLSASELKK